PGGRRVHPRRRRIKAVSVAGGEVRLPASTYSGAPISNGYQVTPPQLKPVRTNVRHPPGAVWAMTHATETRYSTTASAGTVALILFLVDEVWFVQTFKSL